MKKLKILLRLFFAVNIVTARFITDPEQDSNYEYKMAYSKLRRVAQKYLKRIQSDVEAISKQLSLFKDILDTVEDGTDLSLKTTEDISCRCSPPFVEHASAVVIKVNNTQVAVYACIPGYTYASGENTIRCDHEYGQWGEVTFRCTECFLNGLKYKGTISKTQGGIECQRWDSESPHKHDYNKPDAFPDNSITAAENYCRAFDEVYNEPWCYTTNPNLRWDYCGLPKCYRSLENDCGPPSSLTSKYATTYLNYTTYGARASYRCDAYSDLTFVEYCPVSVCTKFGWSAASISCGEQDCVSNSSLYLGKRTCTVSGRTCQRWYSENPHSHKYTKATFPDGSATDAGNYCRDPSGYGTIWCYTMDPRVSWEVCDVPSCD